MTAVANELVRFGERLDRLGMCPGTSGNISARIDDRILVSPTGALERSTPTA